MVLVDLPSLFYYCVRTNYRYSMDFFGVRSNFFSLCQN